MSSFTELHDVQVPDDIECECQLFDLDFHPSTKLIAAGLIDGEVDIYQYGINGGDNKLLAKAHHHRSSCRGVLFSEDGGHLYSISSDKSLVMLDSIGKIVLSIPNH